MNKTELKENIVNINKLLRSDNYQAGIELIKTLDNQEIRKDTALFLNDSCEFKTIILPATTPAAPI